MLSGMFNLTLPETLGVDMTQTVREGHEFVKENMCGYSWYVCAGEVMKMLTLL